MELEFTEEQEELRAGVRTFLERECPMTLVRSVAEKGVPPDELWAQMVDLGWPALTVPEACGGLGLGFIELVVVVEELGRAVAPGPFLATVTQFVPALREAGTPGQQHRFLSAVAAGSLTGTLAAGEGVAARRTGDRWVLDGRARHVLDGDRADELVVAAGVEGGVGLFVVPGDAVRATPVEVLDATRPIATVELDAVTVEDDRALGTPGRSQAVLDRVLEEAAVALATETVGTCQSIFDLALGHAQERHQFGVPIGSFQAVKHKFADMLVALERARVTCYFAALTIAEEDAGRSLAASVAKSAAGDAQRLIVEEGIQILGGIGYTWEHDMQLHAKRAKTGDALLGTAADHRSRVADALGLVPPPS